MLITNSPYLHSPNTLHSLAGSYSGVELLAFMPKKLVHFSVLVDALCIFLFTNSCIFTAFTWFFSLAFFCFFFYVTISICRYLSNHFVSSWTVFLIVRPFIAIHDSSENAGHRYSPVFWVCPLLHVFFRLDSEENTALLLDLKIAFKDLLDWKLEQRRESEYGEVLRPLSGHPLPHCGKHGR